MNTTSSLKVTVNGKKYLITGIQKETSCKDLLCAIAKVTKNPLSIIKESRIGEEKSFRAIYGVKTSEIKCEENLLESFKGDRKQVGDLESLKVFNSLGKNAKIVVRETVTIKKEIDTHVFRKPHKKKVRIKEDKLTKTEENKEKKSSKHKSKRTTEKHLLQTFESNHKPKKHRSVDDSDLDSYKQDTLARIKKRRSRVHDDSDIDVYRNLFHIVLDQTKTLNKLQTQSKEVRKTAWIKELQKSSQVYHFLDEQIITESNENSLEMNTARIIDKDDGNDSGLPSPEYDSSESQENQPIKRNEIRSHDLLNNNEETILDQNIDNVLKENIFKDKHNFISNQNKKNYDSLQNNISEQSANTQNKIEQNNKETRTTESQQDQTISENKKNKNFKTISKRFITDDSKTRVEESESLMSSKPMVTEKSLLTRNFAGNINSNNKMLVDDNKNVILTNDREEEASRKMVAFDVALSQQKYYANTSKKFDKKKIKKTDISDPLLLSPSTFKRHKSLKKAEAILGVETADVLPKDFKISQSRMSNGIGKETEKKDKETFYNKKLKEIRSKKIKKFTKSEPEYSTKFYFEEDKTTKVQSNDVEEILELNVFEKKNKSKQKNKKVKINESKNKQKTIENKKETIYTNSDSSTREKEILNTSLKIEKNNQPIEVISNKNNNNHRSNQKILNDGLTHNNVSNENKLSTVALSLKIENDRDIISSNGEKQSIADKQKELKVIDGNNTYSQITCPDNKTRETNESHNNNSDNTPFEKLTEHTTVDDLSDISSVSSMSNTRTSIISSSSEIQPVSEVAGIEDMILQYHREQKNLNDLIEKILDYNLLISQLAEELEILSNVENFEKTDSELEKEEREVFTEIESIKSLLRSVADLTNYQRKEMTDNLALLDKLDLDVRTRKAGYDNLKNGVWKTSSQSAPRWLIKKRNAQNGGTTSKQRGTSFV